jgi:hypothetical protein
MTGLAQYGGNAGAAAAWSWMRLRPSIRPAGGTVVGRDGRRTVVGREVAVMQARGKLLH